MVASMEKARDALRALTIGADGVDGSKLYLYGEGWDHGEVGGVGGAENAQIQLLYCAERGRSDNMI